MGIKIRSLGNSANRRLSDGGCCGGGSSRSLRSRGLGDPIMTLDGLGRRGLGISTDDFVIWTKPPPPPTYTSYTLLQPEPTLMTAVQLFQPAPIDSEPPPLFAEPAPAPAAAPTDPFSTGTFAPENPPPAQTSSAPPVQSPSQETQQVQGGENTVKIALAVGGTLVLAAFIMKGR